MADPITTLPQPTKNIMELADADPSGSTHLYAEVVQDGNSRKVEIAPRTDAILDGAPVASTPPPEAEGNEIATAEWTKARLDELDLTPDAPGEPTNGNIVLHTTLDQDGKVVIFAVVTWDAPVPVRPAWNYEVRYTKDGTDPDSKTTGEPGAKIRVESGAEYVFKIRTTGKDNNSDLLTLDSLTTVKKMIAPPAPSGMLAVNGHHRVKLKWDNPLIANPTFYDYAKTIIYRSATNNFAGASEIARTDANYYVDDGLANGTTWYYWITHLDTSRNEGAKHPTSNTAGVEGIPNRITDDDTDTTPPNKPTSLLITPRTRLSDDGRLILEAIVTWSAPSGGLSSKGEYVVWMKNMTTGDVSTQGTDRDERSATFRVNDLTTYNFKVRAKNGNGQAGDWCDPVILVTDRKATYAAVASGLTAVGTNKRVRLNWDALTGLDLIDYNRTLVYRSNTNNFAAATIVGRPSGTEFIDDNIPNAVTRYYWIAHQDNSRNVGARFPAAPATNNGIPATTVRAVQDDIDALAVDTDQMQFNSVTALQSAGAGLKVVAHFPTAANGGAEFGWGGNSSGTKYNFSVVIGESGPVRNQNPGPVTIIGSMSLVQDCTDTGYDGTFSAAGKSEVVTSLVLQYKRTGGDWKPVPKFKGPRCRESAGRDDDMHKQKAFRSVKLIHKPDVADVYFYRVLLTGYHRRGSDRQWDKADVLATFSLKMQYTKR